MPGQSSNVGLALGSMASVFAQKFAKNAQQEHDDKMEKTKLVTGLVMEGLRSGSLENPEKAIPFMLEQMGIKKLPPQLKTVLDATSAAGKQGQQPQPGGDGMPVFSTPAQVQGRADEALRSRGKIESDTAGATTTANLEAKKNLAERWITQGMDKDEAYERVGLKQPVPKAPQAGKPEQDPESPTGWSINYYAPDGVTVVRTQNAAPPSSVKQSSRSHLTGEALQAYDMNQMLTGIDPETGKAPEDPADKQRLIEAGKEMKRSRDLKNQSLVIKVESGKSTQSDLDNLAEDVSSGRALPSMLGAMGQQKGKVMAATDRLRKEQGLPPLNYTNLQLQFYRAQRQIAALQGPQMIRFKGLGISVVNTIDEVKSLADELKQGGVQKFNKAKRSTILEVYGNSPQSETAVRYIAAVNTLKEEYASLAQGGYAPTEPAWALANQQINGDYGLKDLHSSLDESQRLINFRLGAFDQMEAGIGLSGDASGGAGNAPPPAGGDKSALLVKARQHLLDMQKQGTIPKDATIDTASVEKWLAANPTFK